MTKKIRTFICIDFPNVIIKEIARVQSLIQNIKFTGKLTELENLHLTLKFLGEIDKETASLIKQKVSSVKFQKFEAKLENAGIFACHSMPKIVWVKVGGKGIFELQKKIDEILSPEFKPEIRFMSHLTIARIKYVNDAKGLYKYVKNIHVAPLKFKVNSFFLKESELGAIGPVYKIIEEYKANK